MLFLSGLTVAIVLLGATCLPAISHQNSNAELAVQNIQSPLPPPAGFVNDYANVLDESTKNQLESTLTLLKERSGIEFGIAVIDTTGGQPIKDYSLAVARGWGIGPKDTTKGGGLLLLIAVKDRKWRIEVSRSLEKDLPDDVSLEIGKLMNEPFRQQRYSEGVKVCVDAIIGRLAELRGFVMGKDERVEVETKRRP